jgi:aspartate racemase
MAEHIGIVACSSEGASLCYRTICLEGAEFMGEHWHPDVTMHTYPLGRYEEIGDWSKVGGLMLSSARKLARAGADFVICPDNTIHEAFDEVARESPIPWLHIAEVVAEEAARAGYKRLGLLGTRRLMEGPVYPPKLAARGIEHEIPEPQERQGINQIIFDQLVKGAFTDESRLYFARVIDKLKEKGCDAVVLGCTEIPLLVTQESSSLPILDSTRLLAKAALRRAIGSEAQ